MLRNLIAGGVDVFRLNFSHGTHDSHRPVIQAIKELREEFQELYDKEDATK